MMKYGRYEIVKELGRGSMGVVYLAFDPQMNSDVALKVLKEHLVVDENIFQRFLQEAQITRLVANPNIVIVFDMGRDHGTNYIVMEFIDGKPLDKIINESKQNLSRLTLKEIIDIGIQVAGALDFAHKKNVIHRDIKPSNIIRNSDDQVKITDFGIARIKDRELEFTRHGTTLGTPLYMSPEQTPQEKQISVDERSDLWSLGVILYELIMDRTPFKGKESNELYRSIQKDKPEPPYRKDESLPKHLPDVILKSLEKNPKKRFQTGAEMKSALESCLLELKNGNEKNAFQREKVLKRTALSSGIIVLLFGLAFFIYHFITPKPPKALLKVITNPVGAQVFIDNKPIEGNTPLEIRLLPGKHEIRLWKIHYYPWEALFQLDEKGETIDRSLKPIKKNGS